MKRIEGKPVSPLVLIVDDDATTSRMLQGILAGEGFRTAIAGTVAGAWAGIREHNPDLMLLDVNLPDGCGFDICQKMQKEPGLGRIPVLFISANDELADKVHGFEAGGVDYISKPLAGAEVRARVITHLRLKRAYEAIADAEAERMDRLATAQQNTMPQPQDMPDARFQVAIKQKLQAGGDFYDVIRSGENSVDYLVADASGHDLGASYWTAALKALVAEYANPLNAPADVLRALNNALSRILPPGAFFTLIYARLNRRSRRLILANAGHPPAIITMAKSHKSLVVKQEGDVVGAFPDPVFGIAELTLHPGDRLFFVFGRGGGKLRSDFGRGGTTRRSLSGKLRCASGRDDTIRSKKTHFGPCGRGRCGAIGGGRMKPQAQHPTRTLSRIIPSRLNAVDAVCLELRAFLSSNNLAKASFAVELIARECLNNAILHGNKCQAEKKTTLSLRLGRRWMRLQITDEGAGFNWRKARQTLAHTEDTHGRGISIGIQYADRVSFNRRGNQITLWLDNSGIAKRHNHGKIRN